MIVMRIIRHMNRWQLLVANQKEKEMTTVEQAEQLIQSQIRNFGTEYIPFELTLGRVLAEDIIADRDLPPFNRVTMDGIAVSHYSIEKGIQSFKIK
jgi:molybdopterin molybdotransferase